MTITYEQLKQAGLPVSKVYFDFFNNQQVDFTREITTEEWNQFLLIKDGEKLPTTEEKIEALELLVQILMEGA